ncbi:MAG TPA: MFS transporter [Rhizomicrobium sp.]|jgi:MFS family permease
MPAQRLERVPLRHVIAAFAGNALAFYDFVTFSYFSVDIGRTFFPSRDPATSLLASLAVFGIGFLARPFGAIVIGRWGDRAGRVPAMMLSFALMGLAIFVMVLTPSYASIGIAAPIIVVASRLVQGFALGGEIGPTTAFVAELVPPRARGFYLSMQLAMQDVAQLAAGIIGVILASALSEQQLSAWGWRAAMLIGVSIVPFVLYVRRSLPETLGAEDRAAAPAEAQVQARRIRPYLPLLILSVLIFACGTIGSYSLSYMTTYARSTLHLATTVAFGFTIVNGAVSIATEIASGWLSDRFGRKPVMFIPGVLLLVSIWPCYWVIGHFHSTYALYGAETVMVFFAGVSSIPIMVALTEQLPASARSGAVAIVYSFAIAVFGGSTQWVITKLIAITGNPLAPAWYWTAATFIGLVAILLMRESAPVKAARLSTPSSGTRPSPDPP